MRSASDKSKSLQARISRLLRHYFDLGLIGMSIASPTRGIIEANNELCKIVGYERSELLRMTWADLTHPDDLSASLARFEALLAGESDGYSIDKRLIHKDGHVIDVMVSVKCVRRPDGSVHRFLALLQDVTERTRRENELHLEMELRVAERTQQLTALNEELRKEITERWEAEGRTREANERVEMILNSITDRFFAFDKEWRITAFNKAAAEQLRLLGKNPATFIGKTLWEEFPNPPAEQVFRRAMSERTAITDEHYYPPLEEWVENRIYPSPDGGLAIFQRYVTERKRTEEKLRRSEAYLAEGQRISHTGSWAFNISTAELYWSLEHCRISGVNPETFNLTVDTAQQLIHPEDRPSVMQAFWAAIQERSGFEREFRCLRPDGTIRHVRSLGHPVLNEAGEATEFVGTMMDITDRKEEELARKELQRRLLAAQEDERRRISHEMHDELGQRLSALTLKLAALKSSHGQDVELCKQLEKLETITKELDADADLIVWQLRPTALDDLGLSAALTNYVKRWSEHFGIHAQLHVRGMEPNCLTSEIETVLYRILQEALTNVAKHAGARKVEILLERDTAHVSLIIEDNGKGFDADEALGTFQKGLGLVGIRERASLVGGAAEIESRKGDGTTVVVRIPAPHMPKRGKIG
jgi:PAS domain S-box-containing protein